MFFGQGFSMEFRLGLNLFVARASLELTMILLPQPPTCCILRHGPPSQVIPGILNKGWTNLILSLFCILWHCPSGLSVLLQSWTLGNLFISTVPGGTLPQSLTCCALHGNYPLSERIAWVLSDDSPNRLLSAPFLPSGSWSHVGWLSAFFLAFGDWDTFRLSLGLCKNPIKGQSISYFTDNKAGSESFGSLLNPLLGYFTYCHDRFCRETITGMWV